MGRLFLGLDLSTQSLSATVIDYDTRKIIYETSVSYDKDLPHYGTQNGVLNNQDPKVVHSPPLIWVEALDLLFENLCKENVPLCDLLAISGSGQQHGSVYLNNSAARTLSSLNPSRSLAENLQDIFSRKTSPIWMDSSTSMECEEICQILGGFKAVSEATGSTTFERFTAPQIRKFYKTELNAYQKTAHILLISSFMSSLLSGKISPIDHGDGAGMNLMDIKNRSWHSRALNATVPGVLKHLPSLAEPWKTIGPINSYFSKKYGLNSNAKSIIWSGDNPNSVIGLGLIRENMIAISLGTSDTYFGIMKIYRTDPKGEGHVFVSPTGDYMTLICFKNGSLAREKVKEAFGLDWDGFSNALRKTPPGNGNKIMLPYFEPEIVPKVLKPGIRRFGLSEKDEKGNCRAVIEAQMISMRIHSAWMGVTPEEIHVTGGGSQNGEILQIMADVHRCPVRRFEVTNSAALGAALRAAHGYFLDSGSEVPWKEIVVGLAEPVSGLTVRPSPETACTYETLLKKYTECEKKVVE